MNDTRVDSQRLDEVIAEFLHAEEAGQAPSTDALLDAHPDLAEELREFLDDRAQVRGLAGEPPPRVFVPPKVRYFGDYELIDEIARGGMGVVYRARQTSLNRIVAIKMILSGNLASEEDVRRFHAEAEAAASLHHTGIVPVHEVGRHDGHHYFSMDYVEGRSLAEIVRENPLPAKKAAEYVQAIAEAVDHAHQQRTLHRDLKPSNVLIDGADHVHVTDFGLAARVEGKSELTHTGQILGTPAYMSPEQAQGARDRIGPASDVYSLGAILYELLTGRPPFKAESSVETLRQVMEVEPVSPRLLNPGVPRDLETICLKCLRKEPGKRFTTAASLAEDLRRWLNSEPILARPVSRVEKVWLWCHRRPAVAGMMVAVLLTCLMLAFTLVQQQRHVSNRVETAVAAMGTTHGNRVPYAIDNLEAFPSELILSQLREQYQAADETQKLALACALAHFGDVRVEYFVSRIRDASPKEVDNLVAALGHSRLRAVGALEAAAQTAEGREEWRHKARLAMLALHLQAPALAHDMCQLRADPIQRTWFIEESSTWHGDLSRLAQLAAESGDVPLRSAVALAAGSAPETDVTVTDRQAWESVLSDWYQNAPDTLTHSAAGWTLRKWGLEPPEIAASRQPVDHRNWHVNSAGMTMLLIPAGSFLRRDDRSPEDAVNQSAMLTRPFLLADREVTRGQFHEFLNDPEAEKPQVWDGPNIRYSPTEQHPVQRVNWYDAVLFCNWLSHREGLTPCYQRTGERDRFDGREFEAWRLDLEANGYRLATEAEWEYACRAGAESQFCHGGDESLLDRYAVYRADRTEIPGSRLPNAWGFFDMHGNVYEWCHDWFGAFGTETAVSDPAGPARGVRRVAHGGSFLLDANLLRSAYRSISPPNNRADRLGFRVARTLDVGSLDAADRVRRLAELFVPALETADLATHLKLIKRFEDCGVTLPELIEFRPDDPALPAVLAKRRAAAGDMTRATELIAGSQRLLVAQLAEATVNKTLVRLLCDLLQSPAVDAETAIEKSDLNLAIAAFQRTLGRNPTSAPECLSLGDALATKNKLAAAIEAYRQATEFDPSNTMAHCCLGRVLYRSGTLSKSIDAFRQAYELEPDNSDIQTDFITACLDAGQPEAAIDAVRSRVNSNPNAREEHYLLARLLRYVGDVSGYCDVCRTMFDRFSASDDLPSRHDMLSAWLFFPEGEPVTPELLEVVKEHAARGYAIHKRMLGMAYYRRGDDGQALPILERVAATGRSTSNSKIASLLCLALVQLRMEQLDAARKSIAEARTIQESEARQSPIPNWQPWDVIPSLWREVTEAMETAGVVEPVPGLPPTYAEWPTTSVVDTDEPVQDR